MVVHEGRVLVIANTGGWSEARGAWTCWSRAAWAAARTTHASACAGRTDSYSKFQLRCKTASAALQHVCTSWQLHTASCGNVHQQKYGGSHKHACICRICSYRRMWPSHWGLRFPSTRHTCLWQIILEADGCQEGRFSPQTHIQSLLLLLLLGWLCLSFSFMLTVFFW